MPLHEDKDDPADFSDITLPGINPNEGRNAQQWTEIAEFLGAPPGELLDQPLVDVVEAIRDLQFDQFEIPLDEIGAGEGLDASAPCVPAATRSPWDSYVEENDTEGGAAPYPGESGYDDEDEGARYGADQY